MPVYVESGTILELDTIYLKRRASAGILVSIPPAVLTELLKATPVSCASVD